jgi:hypothetical protein
MCEVIGFIDLDNRTKPSDVKRERQDRRFRFTVPYQISKEQAISLQEEMGYAGCAYGFFGFENSPNMTVWYCSDSSD